MYLNCKKSKCMHILHVHIVPTHRSQADYLFQMALIYLSVKKKKVDPMEDLQASVQNSS